MSVGLASAVLVKEGDRTFSNLEILSAIGRRGFKLNCFVTRVLNSQLSSDISFSQKSRDEIFLRTVMNDSWTLPDISQYMPGFNVGPGTVEVGEGGRKPSRIIVTEDYPAGVWGVDN
ncbi:hypothetical protein J6590_016309 [Homalodisca vitripennis]|nr:hypothetical protein J6590_016309 [Homalodisca vitripennis]